MEYEIHDDPQGLPEDMDGDRSGGLREGPMFFDKRSRVTGDHHTDDSSLDEDSDESWMQTQLA